MLVLRASHLSKSYAGRTVLDDVSLEIAAGERVGVVGANGCGKSTLLALLAGAAPDRGVVERLRPGLRVGLVPQHPDLPPGATVLDAACAAAAEARAVEADLERLAEALPALDGEALRRALERYGALQETFERLGGYDLEANARRALAGLGLGEAELAKPVAALSGGQRTRLALARALVAAPDLLLLDEPTNHLDFDGLEWLEEWLRAHHGAVVVVSHDRAFLDAVATRIVEIEDRRLRSYPGAYAAYREAKALAERQAQEAYARAVVERERLLAFVRRQRARAEQIASGPKRGRDHYGRVAKKVARQALAAERRVARMPEPEKPRARDRAWFALPDAAAAGNALVVAEGLGKAFGGRPVFSAVYLAVLPGERVALIGPNGSGKTTLLRIVRGDLPPDAGRLWVSPAASIGVYRQHLDGLDPVATATDALLAGTGLAPREARALLATILIRGERAQAPVAALSVGERARLALLRLALSGANLLLLDEPTNHLDLPSRERLEETLLAYDGAMVIAGHDRALLDRLCTRVLALEPAGPVAFPGSPAEYRARRRDLLAPADERLRRRARADRLLALEAEIARLGATPLEGDAAARYQELVREAHRLRDQ